MAKKYTWKYTEQLENGENAEHSIELRCSMLSGKAIITIDGDRYDISVRPLSLRGTSQVFRLGDEAAAVEFPKRGEPTVTVGSEKLTVQK